MKKFIIQTGFVFLMIFICISTTSFSQGKGNSKKGNSSVKEKGGPPPWAPAHGYRAKTRYVYFQDHGVYYDHDRGVYISLSGGNWQISAKLPSLLSGIDLTAAVKVDLDFSGDDPHKHHNDHKKKYPKRKGKG